MVAFRLGGAGLGWSGRRLRLAALGGVVGLVACAGLVWSGAYAAFSSATANPTSTLSTGTWASQVLKWFGDGRDGQGGVGDFSLETSPGQESSGATTWNAVSGGGDHGCATRTDNTLWCWGDNTTGQLGLGDLTQRNSPTQIPGTTITGGVYSGNRANQTFIIP